MDAFSALNEPTRREIIEMLLESGQLSASEIYKKFASTPPAISQHLKVLKETNLVKMEKKAQQRIYEINPSARDWIEKMMKLWNDRFDRLDALLKSDKRRGVSSK